VSIAEMILRRAKEKGVVRYIKKQRLAAGVFVNKIIISWGLYTFRTPVPVPNHAVYQVSNTSRSDRTSRNQDPPSRTARIANHSKYPSLPVSRSLPFAVSCASILSSSRPLEVTTAAHDGHTLVHDRLADPKVAVDPLPDSGGFGEGV
jgi:hypothetical protein